MSITINDPALFEQLLKSEGTVEIKSPAGYVIGKFTAEGFGKLPPGVKSPFSEEELKKLRNQRDGRPLADILRDLESVA